MVNSHLRSWVCVVATIISLSVLLTACTKKSSTENSSSVKGSETSTPSVSVSTTPVLPTTSTIGISQRLNQILEQLKTVKNQLPVASANTAVLASPLAGTSQLDAAASYLDAVVVDVDKMWTKWFKLVGLEEPLVDYRIIKPLTSYSTKCAGGPAMVDSTYPNAFFCSSDVQADNYHGTIVLPLTTFLKMWSGNIFNAQSKSGGDFAAATIVAHEFGHHIEDELQRQGAYQQPSQVMFRELEADCFSGVWARSVYAEGKLEDGDIQEAMDAVFAIGDFAINDPNHHGTPSERVTAWKIGYYGSAANPKPAVPYNCMVAYHGNNLTSTGLPG